MCCFPFQVKLTDFHSISAFEAQKRFFDETLSICRCLCDYVHVGILKCWISHVAYRFMYLKYLIDFWKGTSDAWRLRETVWQLSIRTMRVFSIVTPNDNSSFCDSGYLIDWGSFDWKFNLHVYDVKYSNMSFKWYSFLKTYSSPTHITTKATLRNLRNATFLRCYYLLLFTMVSCRLFVYSFSVQSKIKLEPSETYPILFYSLFASVTTKWNVVTPRNFSSFREVSLHKMKLNALRSPESKCD